MIINRSIRILLLLGVATTVAFPALACGDKFLVNSKCVQTQMLTASNPGTLLLVRNPNSDVATIFITDDLVSRLTAVGHSVVQVENINEASVLIEAGGIDVVLSDVADIPSIESAVDYPVVFLPIVGKKAKETQKTAKAEYKKILKAPGRTHTSLLIIEDRVKESRKNTSSLAASP